MHEAIKLEEKYERNGWPSLARPDLKPPAGWSLSLITGVDRVRNHALSPDGTRIAFIWDRADLSDVYVMPATGGWPGRVSTHRALTAYWSDEVPRWSPDGAWLAFTMDDHVHVAPAGGGEPRKISDFAAEASAPVWMPDSRRLIVSVERDDRTQLVLTDRDGAWPRGLVTAPGGDAWDAQPAPDGRTVAFTWRPFDDLNRHDIRVVDVASGAVRTLTGTPKQRDWSPRWSPDGGTLAFLSERSGFDEVWLMDGNGAHTCAGSPAGAGRHRHRLVTGRHAAGMRGQPGRRVRVDAGGRARRRRSPDVARRRGFHSRPCWSPDGARITVEYEDPVTPPDLYRVDVSSGRTEQLTFSQSAGAGDQCAGHAGGGQLPGAGRAGDPGLPLPSGPAQRRGRDVSSRWTLIPVCLRVGHLGPVPGGQRAYTFLAPNYRAAPATAAPLPKPTTSPGARATWRIAWMRRAFSTPWTGSTRRGWPPPAAATAAT
ncbi:MAG: PD40 domain-containing protein [Caldilineaceae bacterium]|nr:PD40 domain-containing protein [Caldilineaceae bacterium]